MTPPRPRRGSFVLWLPVSRQSAVWRYLRQITPARNPSPRASASVASGRSWIASSSESPSEEACDCAAVGDDARADRRRRSPWSPYWRAHVSCHASPALAQPRRCRSPRPKSGQKDRQSHLSCSPSPFPGGQRRCRRLCLAFRCFVQRRTESQMSSVPPKHSVNVNAGPRGRFRRGRFSGPRQRTAVASGSAPPSELATKGTPPSAPKARSRTRARAEPRAR